MTSRTSLGSGWRSARPISLTLALTAVAVLAAGLTCARAEPPDATALRNDLVAFADGLARLPTGESAAATLRDRVLGADGEAMRALTEALAHQPGWPATRDTLRTIAAPPRAGPRAPIVEPGSPSDICNFEPASTGTLFGAITARSVLEMAAAAAHATCDIDVAGFNAAPACVAGGILDALIAGAVLYLDIQALCADELDSLAHDAAFATQEGMTLQLDSIEIKLDASSGAAQETAERQLERHVRACEPLVSLSLPRAYGGGLEDVRDLVATWLARAQLAAVGDIPEATRRLQLGNQALDGGAYRIAFRSYCLAYKALFPR
jgi:hypothetical protein